MSIYSTVKDAVDTRTAAEHYGYDVNRAGMMICPFHDDHNPSMKVDERYHCFGCQADGDVVDFVSNVFGIGKYEAAVKLVRDFNLRYEISNLETVTRPTRPVSNRNVETQSLDSMFFRKVRNYYKVLTDYRALLDVYIKAFAPNEGDDELHELFAEAIKSVGYVDYLLSLATGTLEGKIRVVFDHGEEVEKYAELLNKLIAKIA